MTDTNLTSHPGTRRRWLGLAMLSIGVAMIIVDATIVNVAVPSIARDLGLSGTTTEWVNTIYALVFAAFRSRWADWAIGSGAARCISQA